MSATKLSSVNTLDALALRQMAAAEDAGDALAPVFVDTLVRLSAAGLVRGDERRGFLVTVAGRRFLDSDPAQSSSPHSSPAFERHGTLSSSKACRSAATPATR